MSTTSFAILLFLFAGTAVSGQRCQCQYIEHPQRRFCEAAFAFRGEILDAVEVEVLLDVNKGLQDYLMYNVSITENFKGDELYKVGSFVMLFTPIQGMCYKGELFFEQQLYNLENDYLFTGDVIESSQNWRYNIITNCNWIQRWGDVTKDQKAGVRGRYSDCGCTIYRRSEALNRGRTNADNFGVEDCIYNPISAVTLGVPDCETEYGFCTMGADGFCSWNSTTSFSQCFSSREAKLNFGAAAITSKEQCNLYEGKQKKKCLLKLRKANRGQ